MRLIILFGLVALIATVFSAPNPGTGKEHQVAEAWSPDHGPFGAAKDGGVDEVDHSRSKRWGGWGWGRPWGMGWGRPWGGYGWRRPWGMGGWGGYGGYGWGR
ncbi:CBN-CNC-6 protein [Caenorhabditis brenneri]|uniref:CBN-CNC-6 protein n=1 Tax=Caenorhabditis brenneri TaxID=135651 RepID=G0NBX6_CAEBE|nr:CBN-CNC-6 protein [Caenorhabditis brenneri]